MSEHNPHLGSSFEEFLQEEGMAAEANAAAVKQVLAWQIREAMKQSGISKSEMARRMHTTRSYLDRFLEPGNTSVQLDTIERAASALGRRLKVELI